MDATTEPPQDASQHQAWNEALSRKYDGFEDWHKRSWFPIRWVERQRVRDVLGNLHLSSDQERVLDVGCGPGFVLEQVPMGELHGVDLSEHLVEMARQRLDGRAEIRHGSAEELPYESGIFDAVFCTEVLEHTLRPDVAIAECVRVLKPGGRLVLTVPNERLIDKVKALVRFLGLGSRLSKGGPDGSKGREGHEWHLHYLDGKSLAGWAEEAGAARVQQRGSPLFFLPLHFVVTARKI